MSGNVILEAGKVDPSVVKAQQIRPSLMLVGHVGPDPKGPATGVALYFTLCDCAKPECAAMFSMILDAECSYHIGSKLFEAAVSMGFKPPGQA